MKKGSILLRTGAPTPTYQPEPQWNPVEEVGKKKKTLSELSEQGKQVGRLLEKEAEQGVKKKRRLNHSASDEEEDEVDDYKDYGEDENWLGQFSNLDDCLAKSQERKRISLSDGLRERLKEIQRVNITVTKEQEAIKNESDALKERQKRFRSDVERLGPSHRCYKTEMDLYREKQRSLVSLLRQKLLAGEMKKLRQRLLVEKRGDLEEAKLRALFTHVRLGSGFSTRFEIYCGELDGYAILLYHCVERPDQSPYIMLRSDSLRNV
jgi:hypothetical protein